MIARVEAAAAAAAPLLLPARGGVRRQRSVGPSWLSSMRGRACGWRLMGGGGAARPAETAAGGGGAGALRWRGSGARAAAVGG